MMRVFLFVILWFVLSLYGKKAAETVLSNEIVDPHIYRNINALITDNGYPLEEHTVRTADGYLLCVHRIPHGRNSYIDSRDQKDVVLLIHGILADASTWVNRLPGKSLGFVLSDKGYDVWLLNTRGSAYSKKHAQYTVNNNKFWNFSFDQVAQYDVPATIDYLLESTGKENLYIIAHSQGTTATFAMLSEMPEYNDKVKLFIALAPVAFLAHLPHTMKHLDSFVSKVAFLLKVVNSGELFPNNDVLNTTMEIICQEEFCENFFFAATGIDKPEINGTTLKDYISSHHSSSSAKSIVHYTQLLSSKKFRKFDYGRRHNLKYYHQEEPPEYRLTRVTTPVALFWSKNDKYAVPEDVATLRSQLNSLVFDYKVPYPYKHNDFFVAANAAKIINEPILQLLSQY